MADTAPAVLADGDHGAVVRFYVALPTDD